MVDLSDDASAAHSSVSSMSTHLLKKQRTADSAESAVSGQKMETQPAANILVSALSVLVHPYVILNISDHFTSVSLRTSKRMLFRDGDGIQKGRSIELMNSFDLPIDKNTDGSYLIKHFTEFKKVLGEQELMGWYTVSTESNTAQHVSFHAEMSKLIVSPIVLYFNPSMPKTPSELTDDVLPISIFDIEIRDGDEANATIFSVPYSVAAEDAERITLDHLSKLGVADSSRAVLPQRVATYSAAVDMMKARLALLLKYLDAVIAGQIQNDPAITRHITWLLRQLPIMENQAKTKTQYSDVMLTIALSIMMKDLDILNNIADNAAYLKTSSVSYSSLAHYSNE